MREVGPRLSIVLPIWKSARTPTRQEWLSQAIWSILDKQTYKNFELIVVDDGSDDNDATFNVARQACAGDIRVRMHQLPKNAGQHAALNFGFQQARGELWTFITDDNMWSPDCYAKLIEGIDQGYDLVYAPFIATREEGRVLMLFHNPYDPELFAKTCACGISFVYTAELAKRVGGFADTWCADFDMWHRMQDAGARILSLPPPPLGIFFEHVDSVTARSGYKPEKKIERAPTSSAIVWLARRAARKGKPQVAIEMLKDAEQIAATIDEKLEIKKAFEGLLT